MLNKIFRRAPILLAGVLLLLSGCKSSSSTLTPDDLNTVETDNLKLTVDFAGKDFRRDGVGEVRMRSHTDGDTTRFYASLTNNESFPLRYLGINTPESTGKIQPWGNAASEFVKDKLTRAERIVVITDRDVWAETDSSGNRYLGFVWYKMADQDFRLLNLEIVEMAYSENLLFDNSQVCNYFNAFRRAGDHAEATGARIYGQEDPSFDYSNQIYDLTINFIRRAYGNTINLENRDGEVILDGNDEPIPFTLTNSTRVRLRAVIVGTIAGNFLIRDVYHPRDDGLYESIFAFTLYRQAPYSTTPGSVVEFYCKVTDFNDNVQLTDIELKTYDLKYPFKEITNPRKADYRHVLDQEGIETADYAPYDISDLTVTGSSSLAPYNGLFVKTAVKIRTVTFDGDDGGSGYTTGPFWRKDDKRNMTIYAHFNGTTTPFNLRIDGELNPYVDADWFELDKVYEVSGYIASFYENYQLQLTNNADINPIEI